MIDTQSRPELSRLEYLIALVSARARGALVNGEVVIVQPFSFASPAVLPVTPLLGAGSTVNRVAVKIITAWNGAGAAVVVGTSGAGPGLYLGTGDVTVTIPNTYETPEVFISAAADQIQVGITAGAGATTGTALLLVKFKR